MDFLIKNAHLFYTRLLFFFFSKKKMSLILQGANDSHLLLDHLSVENLLLNHLSVENFSSENTPALHFGFDH